EPATAAETADLAPRAYVAVRVEDDGEGMDAQTLARALEPFFTTKTDGKGTGLGLSMAHGFARQSGGALLIRSARGDGTCVSIILPAGEEVMPEAAPAPSGRAYATRRILLVDDDPAAREASAAMLHEGGHEVVPVASADAAIRAVAGGEGFDLVVSDYLMPGGTGLDLSRMLEARGDRTPLMIITGYIADDVDLGGLPRLRKPFTTAELLDCVEHVARAGSVRVEP
ncbi:MAG: response regulator, partial [Sphingomonas sp.]